VWVSLSGKEFSRIPSSVGDHHCLDDIAIGPPRTGTWEEMRDSVREHWPGANYHNSVGAGFWSRQDDTHLMVAECWPKGRSGLWRWRIAKRPRDWTISNPF